MRAAYHHEMRGAEHDSNTRDVMSVLWLEATRQRVERVLCQSTTGQGAGSAYIGPATDPQGRIVVS